MALDRQGRTLAYGRGRRHHDVAPSARAVGGSSRSRASSRGWTLALRERRTLRFVRRHACSFPMGLVPSAIACEDVARLASARLRQELATTPTRRALVSVAPSGRPCSGAVLRHRPRCRRSRVPRGGKRGTALVAIDLDTGNAANLGRIPPFIGSLVAKRDGTRLAGVAYSAPDQVRLAASFVVDLERRPAQVRRRRSASASGGERRLARGRATRGLPIRRGRRRPCLRHRRCGCARRFPVGTHAARRWSGTSVFGLGWDGRLLRAAMLPAGPVRTARRLPSPTAYAIVAV